VNGETPDTASSSESALPGFFVEWRDGFGPDAADFSPLDFVNQEQAVPFVIAARWLFCPDFIEYRGCVIVEKNRAVGGSGLAPADQAIVDDWFSTLGDDRAAVEAKVNLLNVADLFASVDTTPFEDDLSGLARSIAECWQGLLAVRYPGRRFTVEVYDDDFGAGPEVTFHSVG
jgi:hypothetical protein